MDLMEVRRKDQSCVYDAVSNDKRFLNRGICYKASKSNPFKFYLLWLIYRLRKRKPLERWTRCLLSG